MALLKYFKKVDSKKEGYGMAPSLLSTDEMKKTDNGKKRGPYLKFDPKEKAAIGKYAGVNGVTKALKHFKGQELKKSSVRDWKTAYESQLKAKFINAKEGEAVSVEVLDSKKRGRPPLLGVKFDHQLQERYCH
jgi:hypothetical protein